MKRKKAENTSSTDSVVQDVSPGKRRAKKKVEDEPPVKQKRSRKSVDKKDVPKVDEPVAKKSETVEPPAVVDTTVSWPTPPVRKSKKKDEQDCKADKSQKDSVKRGGKKKTKKRKKAVDKKDNDGSIPSEQKKRGKKDSQSVNDADHDLLSDDYKEGEKKRKRRTPKVKPEWETEYQFNDSFDLVGGDARTHFLTTIDEGHDGYRWCPKFGYRMGHKMCGVYVTPKCKNKLKCDNYEYGLEIKHRYQLKTVDKDTAEKKPKKGDAELDDNSDELLEVGEE